MIFLSHTHADKPIVDNIANKLLTVFGADKVFYDSWSIQPGDGIIDKINAGLSDCKYFFFFVSENSLKSEMVKLEWQNALFSSVKGELKIIPVRLNNCTLPPTMIQNCYIDLFNYGQEAATTQMIDVIKNQVNYVPLEGFQNVRAYVKNENNNLTIEIRAEVYMEPHSKYAILVGNPENELIFQAIGEFISNSTFQENVRLDNGNMVNAIVLGRQTATSPGFPFILKINSQNQSAIKLLGVCRFTTHDRFKPIPVIYL